MSDWSDLAEDAKETSIIHLLLDETRTSQLLQVLDRKVNASTLPANSLISQFIDSASFPTFFLNWIVHQIQPFVAYRVRDESDTNLFEISTSDSQLQRAHRAGSFSTNHTAPSTDAILPSETVFKALKAPSKPKKRMTTNPVSLSVGATLSGNIASATNSTEILVGGSGAGSDNSTEPSNKSISAQKVSSNANIGKKHKSELFPQGFQDAKMRIGASDAESTQFCAAQSPNVISSNVTYNTSSVASSNSSLKGKYEHLDTALSAAGSYGLKQGSALSKASDVRKKIVPYSVQLVPSRVTSPSSNHAVSRMSTVLTSLIINQHITIGDAVLLLAKLCSLSLPDPAEGVQVVVTADDGSKFPTLLTSSDLFHLFTVNTMQCLLPVIKVLGDPVALGFAESPVLQRLAPTIAAELSVAAEDMRCAEVVEDISFSLPDTFIQPFREDRDSRNEYKSQAEVAAYNERERCFDDFSNLLHSYQVIARSDVDGSRTSAFWQTVLTPEGLKVVSLRDCNYSWFANIFVQMLLFHGLNTTSGTSFTGTAASSGVDGTPTAKYQGQDGRNSEVSTPGFSSGSGSGSGSGGYPRPVGGQGTDANKQRKLEERMGPGGTGYQTGMRRLQPERGQKAPYQTPITADPYENPALHFSGNQQFFFRFIVHTDNNRFLRCLEEALAAEIKDLTREQGTRRTGIGATQVDISTASNGAAPLPIGRARSGSHSTDGEEIFSFISSSYSKPSLLHGTVDGFESFDSPQYSTSTQSFALKTVKLRILGKFLGLLTFWPQWSLLVSVGDTGPLSLLARDAARLRGALRPATSYPLRSILEKAWVACRLSYTVPWVVEFLKMMVWDCTYANPQNPYRDVFSFLRSIQRSDLLHPIKGRSSSNRLYVLIEIQNLWSVVNLSDLRRTALPPMKAKFSKLDYGSDRSLDIDEQSRAFSLSFLHHIATTLNEALSTIKKRLQLNLAKRYPMPQSVLRSAHVVPSSQSASSPRVPVTVAIATDAVFSMKKRQTPNLVSLLNTSEVPMSSSVPTVGLSAFSPSTFVFSSPTSSNTKKAPTATLALHVASDPDAISAALESAKGGVATSLMAQFSAAAAGVKHNKPPPGEADNSECRSGSAGLLHSQRMSGSPHLLRVTAKGAAAVTTGSGPGSASKASRSRASSAAAASTPTPTATITATATAARSIQHVVSPSRGGESALAEAGTPGVASSDSASLTDRLEVAFWQQHPQLQNMSGFLLEQVQTSCLAHLRERVAESVRTLWSHSAPLRSTIEVTMTADRELSLSRHAEDRTGSSSIESIAASRVSEYSLRLEAAREAVHASTVIDAKTFLESFIETHLLGALPKLCALYPCHPRVTALAVWLIRKQAREQQGALMAFLSSYALRKLGEVSSASGKQFKKAVDGGLGLKNESALYPIPASQPSIRSPSRDNNAARLRINHIYLSRRSQADRRAKISACIKEIEPYFTVKIDSTDDTLHADKTTLSSNIISIEHFMSKPLRMHCLGIWSSQTAKGRTRTGTGAEALGLLDIGFQNGMARICEAIHDLVEVMAAAAGDAMSADVTTDFPPPPPPPAPAPAPLLLLLLRVPQLVWTLFIVIFLVRVETQALSENR